jgi:hypothetical protein
VRAFDRVDRKTLWNTLYNRGIPHHVIAVIKNMYQGTKITFITKSGKVLPAEINLGVRQGCSMSPVLFNLYLDDAIRQWQSQLKTLYIPNNLKKEKFLTFMFADDQVIISDNEETFQRALHELNKIILDYNSEISVQKTKNYGILWYMACKIEINPR